MNKLLVLLSLSLSFSAFANQSIDDLIGKYYSKTNKSVEFEVYKVLVEQPTLFGPAKFEYRIKLDHDGYEYIPQFGGEYDDPTAMYMNLEDASLSLSTDQECDDPGCVYFSEIEIVVKRDETGQIIAELDVYGAKLEDETEEEEFEKSFTFYKSN